MAVKFISKKNDLDISRLEAITSSNVTDSDLVYIQQTGVAKKKITVLSLATSIGTRIINSFVPTGLVVPWLSSTAPSGWIFADGSTIGNTGSGATYTGTTYEPLFQLLWSAPWSDATLPIMTSAGSSSTRTLGNLAADWTALKRLTTPDLRGRSVFGFDTTAARVNVSTSGINSAIVGATGGADTIILVGNNIPGHTHTVTVTYPDQPNIAVIANANIATDGSDTILTYGSPNTVTPSSNVATTSSTGSGTAVNKMPPTIILPWIIKL